MPGRRKGRPGRHSRTAGGLVRKVLYLSEEMSEELRELAHRERRSESDVLREALAAHLARHTSRHGLRYNPAHRGSPLPATPKRRSEAMSEKVRENRLRRKAERMGLRLEKSRRRDPDAVDFGLYALVTLEYGGAIHPDRAGSVFALDLDEVEEWLATWGAEA